MERGCPYELRDEPERTGASYGAPSTCPVPGVPGWYLSLLATQRRIRGGSVLPASSLDMGEVMLLEVIETDQALGEQRRWEAQKAGFKSPTEMAERAKAQAGIDKALGW